MPIETLCAGYPDEFKVYLEYCRALRFEDAPNYSYLRQLFSDLMKRKVVLDHQQSVLAAGERWRL